VYCTKCRAGRGKGTDTARKDGSIKISRSTASSPLRFFQSCKTRRSRVPLRRRRIMEIPDSRRRRGCRRQYRRCFRICLQVHRHEIVARMGGRDLHRALAVSSTGLRAHQRGRALSASLAGREPAQPFDSAGGQELKLIDSGSHRSTQCTRIDSEENSGFPRRLPSNIRSEQ
jgi:hypothetical protein